MLLFDTHSLDKLLDKLVDPSGQAGVTRSVLTHALEYAVLENKQEIIHFLSIHPILLGRIPKTAIQSLLLQMVRSRSKQPIVTLLAMQLSKSDVMELERLLLGSGQFDALQSLKKFASNWIKVLDWLTDHHLIS